MTRSTPGAACDARATGRCLPRVGNPGNQGNWPGRLGYHVALGLLLLAGCGDGAKKGEAPPPGRAVRPPGQAGPSGATAAQTAKHGGSGQAVGTVLERERAAREREWAQRKKAVDGAPKPGLADKKPKKRDYSSELRAAMGSPVGCLAARTGEDAAKQIGINISAMLMGSGAVSRADVTGAGLQESELSCVKQMAEGLRIASPIEGAPLRVTVGINLEQAAAPTAPSKEPQGALNP